MVDSSDVSQPSASTPAPSAVRARRAIGAIFFIGFGTAWFCWGDILLRDGRDWTLALVIAMGLAFTVVAVGKFIANRSALAEQATSPRTRRAARMFHWINFGQWVLIVVLANVLHNTGLDAWLAPAIMGIVGLHLLPLGAVMRYRPHYFSGILIMLVAAVYPLVFDAGPRSGAGPVAAGLILWASAAFALTAGSELVYEA